MMPSQRIFAAAVSRLAHTNPFLPERIAAERAALGDDFADPSAIWPRTSDLERPNIARLKDKIDALAETLRPEFTAKKSHASAHDKALYADLILYVLYYR